MPEYLVSWNINISAANAQEAAAEALRIQREPESIATVFLVKDKATGVTKSIDLMNYEPAIVMLPDDQLMDIMTDALETAIGYWAAVRQVMTDEDGNVFEFQVRDREDSTAEWKTITLSSLKEAIERIQNEEVEVSPAIKDQFKGVEWNVDADGEDAAVQIAAYGEIVFC